MSQNCLISIEEITVIENGAYEKSKKAFNTLEAILHHPNLKYSKLTSILQINLTDVQGFFSTKEAEIRLEKNLPPDEPEKSKIMKQNQHELSNIKNLFKQELIGKSYLEIKLSSLEKRSKAEKAITNLIGKTFKAGLGFIPGIGSAVKEIFSSNVDSIFEGNLEKKGRLKCIGRAILELNDSIDGIKEVDLFVPQDVRILPRNKWESTPGGGVRLVDGVRKNRMILKKWKYNGKVKLKFKKL